MARSAEPILRVEGLETQFATRRGIVRAVNGLSFTLAAGETLGIVGESGSGKSAMALSLLRAVPEPGRVVGGQVLFEGQDLLRLSEREMRAVRGRRLAMVPQDPLTALNPVLTIGDHLTEVLGLHLGLQGSAARARATELLTMVGIPSAAARLGSYPHQLSGGMRQRVMIAIAIACEPAVLIADEPTTALDATIQAQILELLDSLKARLGMGVLLITHNLGIVAGHCDRAAVMYAGRIVELGEVDGLFRQPTHPYTAGLLGCVPRLNRPAKATFPSIAGAPPDLISPPSGCPFHPRCQHADERCSDERPALVAGEAGRLVACWHPVTAAPSPIAEATAPPAEASGLPVVAPLPPGEPLLAVRDLVVNFQLGGGLWRRAQTVHAVDGVSLTLRPGETLGLVGESGCGKTTTGRAILRLTGVTSGSIRLGGSDILALSTAELRQMRRQAQIVFQDPFASLNPRLSVGDIISEPLAVHHLADGARRRQRVAELLTLVGLHPSAAERYPHQFSGGQRQRIGIARALAVEPRFVVLDEPVSALDVSIQSQILNLLLDLQRRLELTYLFIAHDLAVVGQMSDRVAVMYLGEIVEEGPCATIYRLRRHPYTQALFSAIPIPDPVLERQRRRITLSGEVPSPIDPPPGCRFHTRCPIATDRCRRERPRLRAIGPDHQVACHFAEESPDRMSQALAARGATASGAD